jgi:electron transport complex protein RnfD
LYKSALFGPGPACLLSKDHCVMFLQSILQPPGKLGRSMWQVVGALVPALIGAVVIFGPGVLIPLGGTILGALCAEALMCALRRKPLSITDATALITGLILGFSLPPTFPFSWAFLGGAVAILIGKMAFGGLGRNVFNPALLGRAFLFALIPQAFSRYPLPSSPIDALGGATPLGALKAGALQETLGVVASRVELYTELFIGRTGGSIGETSALALLAGGVFLLGRKIIKWHTPVAFMGSVAVLGWLFGGEAGVGSGDGIVHLLSGGVVLGAFFMTTDFLTAPVRTGARIAFGIGCGALTIAIRMLTPYPEGVMYGILLMNPLVKTLDRLDNRISSGKWISPPRPVAGSCTPLGIPVTWKPLMSVFVVAALFVQLIQPFMHRQATDIGQPLAAMAVQPAPRAPAAPASGEAVPSEPQTPQSTPSAAAPAAVPPTPPPPLTPLEKAILAKGAELFTGVNALGAQGSWERHGRTLVWAELLTDTTLRGYLVESAGEGYGGLVIMAVGVRPDGTVAEVLPLAHNETPGWAEAVFARSFLDKLRGRSVEQLGAVQAVSGSTISSRAVVQDAVRGALEQVGRMKG